MSMSQGAKDRAREGEPAAVDVLERLFEVLVDRREARPDGSYVVQLLDGGWESIAAKIREEALEVIEAGDHESDEALVHEVADLIFHVFVGLAARDVHPDAVLAELAGRFGIGGLEEKAARTAGSAGNESRREDERR